MSDPAPRLDRGLFALQSSISLLILAILSIPLLTSEVYFGADFGDTHLPMRSFYSRCLAEGLAFDWFPGLHRGFYLHGEGQAGMYHPVHLALYGLLPLEVALVIEPVMNYPLLLLGMFLFLRRWSLSRSSSMLGAFLFAFSGFNLLHIQHMNAMAVTAHLPWLLLAIDIAFRSPCPRSRGLAAATIALLTGSQLLLGYPQYVYFSGLAEGAYALLLLWQTRRGLRLFPLALAKGLGLLVGAIQLLPSLEMVERSTRAHPQPDFNFFFSLHPANLIQPIAPYFYSGGAFHGYLHEMGLYEGALSIVLCVWLWIRRKELTAKRSLVVGFALLGGLSLLLALGSYGGVYRYWIRIPGLDLFRCPSRHILLVHLSLSVLSAIAFEDLRARIRAPVRLRGRAVALLLALPLSSLFVAALALHPKFAPHAGSVGRILFGPALVLLITLLLLGSSRGSRAALYGLVLVGCVDLAGYGLDHLYRYRPYCTVDTFARWLPLPPEATSHRILGADNRITLLGYRSAGGYVGLPPQSRLGYGSLPALRLAEIAWKASPDGKGFVPVPDPLPRVRLVTECKVSRNLHQDLPTIDIETTALVDEPLDLDGQTPGGVEILQDEPGLLRVQVESNGRSLLVFSESYHPGWRAAVGERSQAALPVYGDYIGTVVEDGEQEITLEFDPSSLRIGRRLTLLGLLLVGLLVGLSLGRSRGAP